MYSQEFELGGKTKKLRYDFNAIADVEESAGMGIAKIFSADMVGLHTIRLLIWAGLKAVSLRISQPENLKLLSAEVGGLSSSCFIGFFGFNKFCKFFKRGFIGNSKFCQNLSIQLDLCFEQAINKLGVFYPVYFAGSIYSGYP